MKHIARFFFILILFILHHPIPCKSFGILAHEAIVDATWEKSLKPLLKHKYPHATEEELKKAHACVYGGTVIPDLGYYPFGKPIFSDLVHYVRTGDLINNLLEESHNLDEYAFSLGVLCHFEADIYGHSLGVNKAVPLSFPKLKKKYGDVVTYEDGRDEHVRVEFGFDVLQTARGDYRPNAYHDFIGFQVEDSVLERAFLKTYGIPLKSVFNSIPIAIAVYRLTIKSLIPEFTKDAWKIKQSSITQLNPLATEKNYIYKMDKKNYNKEFTRVKPQSVLVTIVFGVLPKYGPLSRFKPKVPSPDVEKLFEQSFDSIVTEYAADLKKLRSQEVLFKDINMDTGKETAAGQYRLADKTYYRLLMKLNGSKFENADDALKKNLVAYFNNDASAAYLNRPHKEKKIRRALGQMNSNEVVNSKESE